MKTNLDPVLPAHRKGKRAPRSDLVDNKRPIKEEKLHSTLTSDVKGLVPFDPKYADLPLLIKRPTAIQLFDRSRKWFQRREASGELTPIKKNQGVVFYRRDELLRAVGLIKKEVAK